MIKKLFMLFSVGMTLYTFYMIRMRPGKMFQLPTPKLSQSKDSETKTKKSSPSSTRSQSDQDNLRVRISKGSGDVFVRRGERSLNVENGFELKFKDRLITGKNSVVILTFAGNSIIKLFSNGELKIGRIQHRDRSDTGTQFNFFHLEKGAVVVDFINRGKMHYLELTSNAAELKVRGTQFLFIHNTNKNRSQLAVLEGSISAISKGMNDTKQVKAAHGVLIKANEMISTPRKDSWVEKIKWPKVAKGAGIDLYSHSFTNEELAEWKKRRAALQKMPTKAFFAKKMDVAKKSKGGSILGNVMGKVLDVAKKGASGLKQASPVGELNEATENMQNFEQAQKDRMKDLDGLDSE